jgi:uncharacterized cofD-like protein
VALGGGHGLSASLSALRLLDVDITAVVTVADDGGSSGRIRRELDVLPPGDLRMALAALASDDPRMSTGWPALLQHRIGGAGALAGHPVGNLLLTGLLELADTPVAALDDMAAIIGAAGRVLPMATEPLDLIALVDSIDPDDPIRTRRIRGQSSIAATPGRVRHIDLVPRDPPACPEAVREIARADVVLLGPGSWFTSVIPHVLVPELAQALADTPAMITVILNLEPEVGETNGFSPEEHLRVLIEQCPSLTPSSVIADLGVAEDHSALSEYCLTLGAKLSLAPVAADGAEARHDPVRLSRAIAAASGLRPENRNETPRV